MKRNVAILATEEAASRVHSTLRQELGPRWERFGHISLEAVPRRNALDASWVQRRVESLAARLGAVEVVLAGNVKFTGSRVPTLTSAVRILRESPNLQSELLQVLNANAADLSSCVADLLSGKWELVRVDRAVVEKWLDQFRFFGQFDWIGKCLLRSIDAYSTADLMEYVGCEETSLHDMIVYSSPDGDELGSSTALAHAIGKRLEGKGMLVKRLEQVDETSEGVERMLLVEDCAISGTEAKQLFKRLEQRWSASSLEPNITLRYAVLANAAEIVINEQLRSLKWPNVRLDVGHSKRIVTLTEAGLRALEESRFYCPETGCTKNPNVYITRGVFQDHLLWGGHEKAKIARRMLAKIGEQLYRSWYKGGKTSAKWFREAGLGVGGLALGLVLGRSVPKSTLPVLWAEGSVQLHGKRLDWYPLFSS